MNINGFGLNIRQLGFLFFYSISMSKVETCARAHTRAKNHC
jgi:hypothetical protein